jgi:hypothetical protein
VFNNAAIRNTGTVSQLLLCTDALWRGAAHELEPPIYRALFSLSRVRAGNPFFVENPPSLLYLGWCVAWVGLMVSAAVFSFRRRDI